MTKLLLNLFLSFLTLGVTSVHAADVELSAGDRSHPVGTIFEIPAPPEVDVKIKTITLVNDEGAQLIVQRDPSNPSRMLGILDKVLPAHETRKYQITIDAALEASTPQVECLAKGKDYEITVHGKPVLLYNAALKECLVEGFAECRRSGFIHPVYAPDGTIVSDDFPPEHPHQHGIMLAWVDSVFRGKPIDFWNSMKQQGVVEHFAVVDMLNGTVFGELNVELKHSQIIAENKSEPVLDESWRIRVFNSVDPHVIEVRSTLKCATEDPLHLNEYHYGGMAFRGARSWSFGKAAFLTSDGKDRESGNHTRPLWTAITGDVDDKSYTVAGMESAKNFRFPQPVRLHPDMPYFCWSPSVLGEFEIAPGKPFTSGYRFYVFNGGADKGRLDDLQREMAAPLVGKLLE
jgi:hypothetical protein